jgi:hypothetical protein
MSFIFLFLLFQNREDGKIYNGFARMQGVGTKRLPSEISCRAKKLDTLRRLWYGKYI